jgi:hypothetical protein
MGRRSTGHEETGIDCFLCTLVDEVENVGDQAEACHVLARAVAYGAELLAQGGELATCDVCHSLLTSECARAAKLRRSLTRSAAAEGRSATRRLAARTRDDEG